MVKVKAEMRQRAILRRAASLIVRQHSGYQAISRVALDLLSDTIQQYLASLARLVHDYTEHSGRHITSLHDFWMALFALRIRIKPLVDFAAIDATSILPSGV